MKCVRVGCFFGWLKNVPSEFQFVVDPSLDVGYEAIVVGGEFGFVVGAVYRHFEMVEAILRDDRFVRFEMHFEIRLKKLKRNM